MTVEQQIVELEHQWASAIQHQDEEAMSHFLGEGYFLAIGTQDGKLHMVPKVVWLDTLKVYRTESYSFDDIQVHVYGETAVVVMLFSQKASVRGQDRSARFVITDIWVKGSHGWRVKERHSSRPEPAVEARP